MFWANFNADPAKERLKYRKASLNRAKEFQNAIKDVAYKTNLVAHDIEDLRSTAASVENLPENERAAVVKNLLGKNYDFLILYSTSN